MSPFIQNLKVGRTTRGNHEAHSKNGSDHDMVRIIPMYVVTVGHGNDVKSKEPLYKLNVNTKKRFNELLVFKDRFMGY